MLSAKGLSGFVWKDNLVEKLRIKHQVDNFECEEIFFNRPLVYGMDKSHSTKSDKRCFVIGRTNNNRLLFAAFKIVEGKILVISSRDATSKERYRYEQKTKRYSKIRK